MLTSITTRITGGPLSRLLRRLPPYIPLYMVMRSRKPAKIAMNDATVMTVTSLCATCDSSCDTTASSSAWSSRRMSPVVAQTTARSWLRPVAKAFGMSVSAIATRGLGMSARAHSRSTIACSSGASCGETTRPPMALSATVSEKNHCAQSMPALMTRATTAPPAPAPRNA